LNIILLESQVGPATVDPVVPFLTTATLPLLVLEVALLATADGASIDTPVGGHTLGVCGALQLANALLFALVSNSVSVSVGLFLGVHCFPVYVGFGFALLPLSVAVHSTQRNRPSSAAGWQVTSLTWQPANAG
jgi:hypothetical protein